MKFANFLIATGELVSTGETSDTEDLLHLHTHEGCRAFQGEFQVGEHYYDVANDEVKSYSAQQVTEKAARPPGAIEWSNLTMSWSITPPSIESVRSQKRDELKLARENAIETPKMTSLGLFDSAPSDQDNLAKVIKLTEIAASKGYPAVARYTRGDNVRTEFTLDQLYTVALELGAVNQPIFDIYDTLRTQLDAAETIEQVQAINWPAP